MEPGALDCADETVETADELTKSLLLVAADPEGIDVPELVVCLEDGADDAAVVGGPVEDCQA